MDHVFFAALTGSGPLPLFTCTCGVLGCGGYYIGVARGEVAWIWRNRYPSDDAPSPAHVIEVGERRFTWPKIRAVAMDLLTTLHTLQRDKPGARLMAAATGIDLRDRLAYYEEQVQVIPKA